MGVYAALSAGDQTNLAGPSTVKAWLTDVGESVYATARINMGSFTYPLAEITVDGTSANWTNAAAGMTVLIGSTSGGRDKGTYRLRSTPTATILPIGEMSEGDTGLMPIAIRAAGLANDDYITILEAFDIHSVLPNIVYTGGTTGVIYEDWRRTVGTSNTSPTPIVNITINGKAGHFAKRVASGTVAITAVATPAHWPTSSSATYVWAYPASFTGVSGATSATLTANAPIGKHTIYCTVSPNVGDSFTAKRHINICDDLASSPTVPSINITDVNIRGDRTGWRVDLTLIGSRLASIPDGRMVMLVLEGTWNGADISTRPNSIAGWLVRRTAETDTGLRQATVELVGPAGMMALLGGNSQYLEYNASPSTWQQVVASLCNYNFAMWYMLKNRAEGLLQLFDYTPFSQSATVARRTAITIPGGTLLSQLQQMATRLKGCNFGCDAAGSMFVQQHPSRVAYASRSGIVTRDTLTGARYKSIRIERALRPTVRRVRGEGFYSDGSTNTPVLSDAPGNTPGQGASEPTLEDQYVESQAELNTLTGMEYAMLNNEFPRFDVSIPKFRDVYQPAHMPLIAVSVAANLSPTNAAVSRNGIPDTVSIRINGDGTADVDLSLEGETAGVAGVTVPVPVENPTIYDVPIDTIFDPPPVYFDDDFSPPPVVGVPGQPDVEPGKPLLYNTATKFYRSYDCTGASPTVEDITPAGVTNVEMFLINPHTNYHRGCYLLTNDGTDSKNYYTADVWATTVIWTSGATKADAYTKLIARKGSAGVVQIYNPNTSGTVTQDLTVSFDIGGYNNYSVIQYPPGVSSVTTGGNTGNCIRVGADDTQAICSAEVTLPQVATVTRVTFDYYRDSGVGSNIFLQVYFYDAGDSEITQVNTTLSVSNGQWYTYDTGAISVASVAKIRTLSGNSLTGGASNRQDNVVVTYQVAAGAGEAVVTYSTDYGATWSSAVSVGNSPGSIGAFDGTRTGYCTLAASDAQLEKATTLSGSFSAETNGGTSGSDPICAVIPWYRVGSISATNYSNSPDYIFQSAALVSGDAMWKVASGAKTAITPSESGNKLLGTTDHGLSTWKGRKIMAIAAYGGTTYICVSTDTGATWTNTSKAGAVCIRCRRHSPDGKTWVLSRGANGLDVTTDGGLTWSAKTVTGSPIYAEIWG